MLETSTSPILTPDPAAERIRIAEEFIERLHITSLLRIGYGNPYLWGDNSRVALIGYSAPGGGAILGGGCPIRQVGNVWFPVIADTGDTFRYGKQQIDYISMIAATASERATVAGATERITPDAPAYKQWIGFLLELQKFPEGLEVPF